MSTPESPKGRHLARQLARELLERETAGATEAARFGPAMQRACTRVSKNLRRFVGEDGYSALFAHAVARTDYDQRVLTDIRRSDAAGVHLDVVTAVQRHGAANVGAAVELLLAALLDILSDLIGADMARALVDHDDSRWATAKQRRQ
jgi:hypothetical protein